MDNVTQEVPAPNAEPLTPPRLRPQARMTKRIYARATPETKAMLARLRDATGMTEADVMEWAALELWGLSQEAVVNEP